jgi:hypothetical protein
LPNPTGLADTAERQKQLRKPSVLVGEQCPLVAVRQQEHAHRITLARDIESNAFVYDAARNQLAEQ